MNTLLRKSQQEIQRIQNTLQQVASLTHDAHSLIHLYTIKHKIILLKGGSGSVETSRNLADITSRNHEKWSEVKQLYTHQTNLQSELNSLQSIQQDLIQALQPQDMEDFSTLDPEHKTQSCQKQQKHTDKVRYYSQKRLKNKLGKTTRLNTGLSKYK